MRKKGRRLVIGGLLVAVLVWLGAKGPMGKAEPARHVEPAKVVLPRPPMPDGERIDAVTAALPRMDATLDATQADLFWGELVRMEAAIGRGDARDAWSRQSRAEGLLPELGRGDPLRQQFARASLRLAKFTTEHLDQAAAEMRLGRVLAAAKLLSPFAAGEQPLPLDFSAAASAHGLDGAMAAIRAVELPNLPAPIPSGRQVRVYREGRLELGQVLRSSASYVTVELRSRFGVLYPELPGFELGLVDPGPEEALDQSLRALHGGDGLLAGLWLTLASDRGAGASSRAVEISHCLAGWR